MTSDNDLILLMEGYRNTMDLNIALSKQIQEIITKLTVLDTNIARITKSQEILVSKEPEISMTLLKFKKISAQCKETILSILTDYNEESTKRASVIKIMIWVGYVGSTSIIATLITILIRLLKA